MNSEKLRFLTPLRGIAALFVAVFHWLFWMKDLNKWLDSHTSFFDRSYIWVDLFFLLSGFVLMHVYQRRLASRGDDGQVKAFYRARFARIYPLYFFSLMCFLVFVVTLRALGIEYEALKWGERFSAESFISNLVMVQALGIHEQLTWNMAAWSISTEFAVYLLFPLLVAALEHPRWRWLLLALAAATFAGFYSIKGHVDLTHDYGFLRCLSEVVFGMAIYKFGYHIDAWRWSEARWPAYVLMGLIFACMHFPATVVPDALVVAAFGLLILALANHRGAGFGWLDSRPMNWLGERSFSFYMNHFLAVELVYVLYSPSISSRVDWHPSILSGTLFVLIVLALNLLASALTYAYIEQPGRAWLKAAPRSRLEIA